MGEGGVDGVVDYEGYEFVGEVGWGWIGLVGCVFDCFLGHC